MYDQKGELLNRFETVSEAAKFLGNKNRNNICYYLNGKQKTAYSYIWKYDKS